MNKEYIAYYRVSTNKQGVMGLGIESQKQIVSTYCNQPLIGEYVEVESGKRNNRPELLKALKHAKEVKATLIIAKLDRLSRNMAFIANMLESGVEFVCCDFPTANRFMLHILAAVAEYERELISKRTKSALSIKKLQGFKLGSPNLTNARSNSSRMRLKTSALNDPELIEMVNKGRKAGYSLDKIAYEANKQGFRSTRDCLLTGSHIFKVLKSAQNPQ